MEKRTKEQQQQEEGEQEEDLVLTPREYEKALKEAYKSDTWCT